MKDLCSAYKGEIVILQEPKDFKPVEDTETLRRLITPELKSILENQLEIRIGSYGKFRPVIDYAKREFCKRDKIGVMNLEADADNPYKYSFFWPGAQPE